MGLIRRNPLCKICCSFSQDILNEITLDILLRRRSYPEIKEYYSPLLPPEVKRLSDVNINNHRKHADPSILAHIEMKKKGEPTTEAEVISFLYQERYHQEIDKLVLLKEIYRERLANLETLQGVLDEKKKAYEEVKLDVSQVKVKNILITEVLDITEQIDDIHHSLQEIVIKELNSEKGLSPGSIHITQNFVNVFSDHLRKFMDEIVPYILLELYPGDSERGKKVVKYISKAMDKHLSPALEEGKLLEFAQRRKN